MPRGRLSMRKIKEIIRLYCEKGFTKRQIARCCNLSPSTVIDYLARVKAAGLTWPLPEDMDETSLEALLFPGSIQPRRNYQELDFTWIHRELSKKSVTLQQLWLEYKQEHTQGYQYSRFCELYHQWRKTVDAVLHQTYKAGEKMFVDYAGQTAPVVDPVTGEVRPAYIFVAALGASNYTYAEAALSLDLFAWVSAHCRAFEFFGGVTETVIPDNTKTAVSHPCYYEPDLNPTYQELASHYGTAVIPARVRKPRDKAKVETAVQIVERWILAPLRNRTFFSLDELAGEIREGVERMNNRPFQKLDGCRRTLYETLEKPALKPLPPTRYEFAVWKKARVNIDYHVDVDHTYYSVPHQLIQKTVELRITANTVEVLYKGRRVAAHPRCFIKGKYITEPNHRPAAHQKYLEWTPSRLVSWARSVGSNTAKTVETILASRPHPEQGYRSCLGILRLSKRYPQERIEAACHKALAIGSPTYQSIKSILEKGLDQLANEEVGTVLAPVRHENLRGPEYYGPGGGLLC